MNNFFPLFLALLSAPALAQGTKDGGGCGAYVCTNENGQPVSYLVDLYEAENIDQRWTENRIGTLKFTHPAPGQSEKSEEEYFNAAIAKLDAAHTFLAHRVIYEDKRIQRRFNFLSDRLYMPRPDDLKNVYVPVGCDTKGMMYYNAETGNLDVQGSVYNILHSNMDRAGARLHEAIYKVLRDDNKQENSRSSRKLVGCLLSDDKACLGVEPFLPNDRLIYQCSGKDYDFTLVPGMAVTDPKEFLKNEPVLFTAYANRFGVTAMPSPPIFAVAINVDGVFWSNSFAEGDFKTVYGIAPMVSFKNLEVNPATGDLKVLKVLNYSVFSTSPASDHPEELPCKRIQ